MEASPASEPSSRRRFVKFNTLEVLRAIGAKPTSVSAVTRRFGLGGEGVIRARRVRRLRVGIAIVEARGLCVTDREGKVRLTAEGLRLLAEADGAPE